MEVDGAVTVNPLPDLAIANDIFVAFKSNTAGEAAKTAAIERVQEYITQHAAAPLASHLASEYGHSFLSTKQLDSMKSSNKSEFTRIQGVITEAKESQGESEVQAGYLAAASYAVRIGDRAAAVEYLDECAQVTVGTGSKLDVAFISIREALFFGDDAALGSTVDAAVALAGNEADWDHKNRLKIYQAVRALRQRKFDIAADLLVSALATYNCTEAYSYSYFIRLACIAALLSFDRVALRTKVTNSPDVRAHMGDHGAVDRLLRALDACEYKDAFVALTDVTEELREDALLAPHAKYFCREVRIRLYSQKLASYRSVQLAAMAKDFGVSVEFLDNELSRFIAHGRLQARIDKVAGVVETNRERSKAVQYGKVIREADILLNRVQKLTRIISS